MFVIIEQKKFNFYIQIFDLFEKLIYEKLISTELSYDIDINSNIIKWIDFVNNSISIFFN